MNIKKTIKKISAIATGAALIGATVTGAVSADLNEYPQPFVTEDGQFDGQIVIGSMGANPGQVVDVLTAIGLAAQLQADAVTPVSVAGGVTTVEGGEVYDDEALNSNVPADTLDDKQLNGFQDSSASVDGNDIDYQELVDFDGNAFKFETSLLGDDEFEGNVYLTVQDNAVRYQVMFEDELQESYFTNDELEFTFLGRNIEVSNLDVANDEITLTTSDEFFLEQGDTVQVDGNTVELVRVGESSVIVEVNGQREVISDNSNKRFSESDNFQVEIDGIFYVEGSSDNGAVLEMGDDLTRTVGSGDPAELFGESDERNEAEWLWDIDLGSSGTTAPAGSYIGLVNNKQRVDVDVNADRERPALAVGESMSLPNNHVDFTFEGLEFDVETEVDVTIDDARRFYPDNEDATASKWTYVISTPGEQGLFDVGGNTADEAFVAVNSTGGTEVWYNDGDDDVLAGDETTTITLEVRREDVTITPPQNPLNGISAGSANTSDHLLFTFPIEDSSYGGGSGEEIVALIAETSNDFFGPNDDDDAGDLKITDDTGNLTPLGTQDYDLHTTYGVFIEEPESQFGSGSSFSMILPEEQQKATMTVTTSASQRTTASTGSEAYTVNPLPVGQIAVLDSDAPALGSTPMLVVGGPYSNSVADDLLGNPSDEDIEEMFTPGEGKLMWFEDDMALMVAGYDPEDTQAAGLVLANYRDYDLTGDEVTVITQDLSVTQVE